MSESLEELKAIIEGANGKYEQVSLCGGIYYRFDGANWVGIAMHSKSSRLISSFSLRTAGGINVFMLFPLITNPPHTNLTKTKLDTPEATSAILSA